VAADKGELLALAMRAGVLMGERTKLKRLLRGEWPTRACVSYWLCCIFCVSLCLTFRS
jgi:hypothetical protein